MHFLLLRRLASRTASPMSSKHFIRNPTPLTLPTFPPCSLARRRFPGASKRLQPIICSKPISNYHQLALKSNGFSSVSNGNAPVHVEEDEHRMLYGDDSSILKRKLTELGIDAKACLFGQYSHLLCPMCDGGDSKEKSLSLFISQDGRSALWMCHRAKCGWKGSTRAFADPTSSYEVLRRPERVKPIREISMEALELKPLCNEILAYFAERMISAETLRRNAVMQKQNGSEVSLSLCFVFIEL